MELHEVEYFRRLGENTTKNKSKKRPADEVEPEEIFSGNDVLDGFMEGFIYCYQMLQNKELPLEEYERPRDLWSWMMSLRAHHNQRRATTRKLAESQSELSLTQRLNHIRENVNDSMEESLRFLNLRLEDFDELLPILSETGSGMGRIAPGDYYEQRVILARAMELAEFPKHCALITESVIEQISLGYINTPGQKYIAMAQGFTQQGSAEALFNSAAKVIDMLRVFIIASANDTFSTIFPPTAACGYRSADGQFLMGAFYSSQSEFDGAWEKVSFEQASGRPPEDIVAQERLNYVEHFLMPEMIAKLVRLLVDGIRGGELTTKHKHISAYYHLIKALQAVISHEQDPCQHRSSVMALNYPYFLRGDEETLSNFLRQTQHYF